MFKEILDTAYVVSKASQPVSQSCEEISHEKPLFIEKRPFYNPQPDLIFDEIRSLISARNITNNNLKKEFNLRKLHILQIYCAFSDQHNLIMPALPAFVKESCFSLIKRVEEKSDSLKRPINVIEQLDNSLEIANQNLSTSIFNLAIATRIMARNYDTRILNLNITPARMKNWKTCVAGFNHNPKLDDPPGDTYHFWFGALAGISSQENRSSKNPYENMSGIICDLLYSNTDSLTKIIQKGIFHLDRKTHPTIDRLGYKIGKSIINC